MGLYDGAKLDNSTFISQYVGSVVPELANFSQVQQKRYNEARDTDDALTEALGNLKHLGLEGDTQYANELKQTYLNRLMERSGREDYENMGRRTKRDAQQFSSEYMPLVQRQKDLSTELERVNQDDKIFSPEKKAQISNYITKMNGTRRDPATGDFERDEMGKVRLGAVKTWAYAKDVDINKKLADFLKAKETDISQGGFRADGSGLKISQVRETRSAAELGRLAKEMMDTDPEIRAMVERDVNLATFDLSPGQVTQMANQGNVSIYDRLKKAGLSEQQIKSNLAANGVNMDTAKMKPVDTLRKEYAARGRNPLDADSDFVRNEVRKQITSPHVDLVANLLKVDRTTLEAREDADYVARATAAAMQAANSGEASPIIVTPDDGIAQIDVTNLHNAAIGAEKAIEESKGHLQTAIAGVLGLAPPNGKNTADWYNQTGRYVNDKRAQTELLNKLKNSGKMQEANNLTQAFRQYDVEANKAVYARQQLASIDKAVNTDAIYNEYKQIAGSKALSRSSFEKEIRNRAVDASGVDVNNSSIKNFFGMRSEDPAIKLARAGYFRELQKSAQINGKSIQTQNVTFEPTSNGYLKNMTGMVEEGLRTGTIKGKDMATGESIDDIIRKELGTSSIWRFGKDDKKISAEDRIDPKSDFNKGIGGVKVRVNMNKRGAQGEPTATITLPSGAILTVTLDNVSKSLPTEMTARMMQGGAKMMTRSEATTLLQSGAEGAGWGSLTNINQAEIYNLRPAAKPYQLNDMYYLKVSEAGIKGSSKTNVYSLMVKQGDKYVPTRVNNRTQVGDIIQAIGGQILEDQMQTTPSQNLFNR